MQPKSPSASAEARPVYLKTDCCIKAYRKSAALICCSCCYTFAETWIDELVRAIGKDARTLLPVAPSPAVVPHLCVFPVAGPDPSPPHHEQALSCPANLLVLVAALAAAVHAALLPRLMLVAPALLAPVVSAARPTYRSAWEIAALLAYSLAFPGCAL